MRQKRYSIKTYGCQMNISDSEKIADYYESHGWQPAEKIQQADEIIINTCSVRQTAEDRIYGLVNNLIKTKSSSLKPKIILTGCMLRYPLRYLKKKLPHVDGFVKIGVFKSKKIQGKDLQKTGSLVHAYVPIMEGCNNFCSYCVVPYARGREESRPLKEIVCEVKELTKRGVKEITLLGQNVNSYGKKEKGKKLRKTITPFAKLLATLHRIEKIKKISFLTSNPWDLDEQIIQTMRLPKVDRYLHLPVQSGDDEVLKKMNRHYSVKKYLKLVDDLRKAVPDIKIGTDIIVGFPQETDKQFENTVALCKKVGFSKAYVSMYSPRIQTVAYKLKDNVPLSEKRKRWKILDELINK